MTRPTASIVIVGDEILAGHTQDTNSHWLADRLRARGVRVVRIEAVPDREQTIEATLRRHLGEDAPAFVFVVGGLGPTPDDRTYEGVRRALGVALSVRAEHLAWMRRRVAASAYAGEAWADPDTSEAVQRMIRIPDGSDALENPVGSALGCVARAGASRVVVLPGVPREMTAMFEASFEPVHLAGVTADEETRELEARGSEAALWDALRDVEAAFPDVRVGSYPQDERGRIVLRLAGPPHAVARAHERLRLLVAARMKGRDAAP